MVNSNNKELIKADNGADITAEQVKLLACPECGAQLNLDPEQPNIGADHCNSRVGISGPPPVNPTFKVQVTHTDTPIRTFEEDKRIKSEEVKDQQSANEKQTDKALQHEREDKELKGPKTTFGKGKK